MKISSDTGAFDRLSTDRAVLLRAMKEAGFEAYDFSMFFGEDNRLCDREDGIERAKEFRAVADEIGIACNQAHAPFPIVRPGDEAYNAHTAVEIERAIGIAATLGASHIIVHPWNDWSPEENAAFFRKLEPTARRYRIGICLENMWNWRPDVGVAPAACSSPQSFCAHLDLLPSDVFSACLDIGHAEMRGLDTSAVEMIEALGPRIEALHVHDNDQIHDSHILPFTGKIAFGPIVDALRRVGYRGDITLEACSFPRPFPLDAYPAVMRLMAQVADGLRRDAAKDRAI